MKIRSILFLVFSFFCMPVFAEPVDINTADVTRLEQALTGIGPSKAQAIIDYRDQHGSFSRLEDLLKVPGIGEATLKANQENLQLGDIADKPAATNSKQ